MLAYTDQCCVHYSRDGKVIRNIDCAHSPPSMHLSCLHSEKKEKACTVMQFQQPPLEIYELKLYLVPVKSCGICQLNCITRWVFLEVKGEFCEWNLCSIGKHKMMLPVNINTSCCEAAFAETHMTGENLFRSSFYNADEINN